MLTWPSPMNSLHVDSNMAKVYPLERAEYSCSFGYVFIIYIYHLARRKNVSGLT
jgi:hypothetical protein